MLKWTSRLPTGRSYLVEKEILKLLDGAHAKRLSALLDENAALAKAKEYFGLRGMARLVGESASNLCNAFNGRRKHSPTLLKRLRKVLEKKIKDAKE